MTRKLKGKRLLKVMAISASKFVRSYRLQVFRQQRLARMVDEPDRRPLLTRLRFVERSRHAHAAHTKLLLNRQQRLLDAMRCDNEEKRTDLAVMKRRQREYKGDAVRLRNILLEYDVIGEENDRRKKGLEELRLRIKVVDEEIWRRSKVLAEKRRRIKYGDSRPCAVFQKLKAETHRYNLELNELKDLRDKVDLLLSRRNKMKDNLEYLQTEVDTISFSIAQHIQTSSVKLKGIQTAKLKKQKLAEYFHSAQTSFDKEVACLDNKIDSAKKLHNFVVEKVKSRGDPRAKEKQMRREKMRATQDRTQMYGELLQQVHALFAEQLDGPYGQLLDRHRRSIRKLDGELSIRKLAASPVIQAKLGKTGLRQIIKSFIEMMEENFYLFKALVDKQEMLGDTSIECDRMKAEEATIHARLSETERDSIKRANEIKETIASYAAKSREVELKIEKAEETIEDYINGVLGILLKMGYTEQAIQNTVGRHEKVSERNITRCMAAIERHLDKLLLVETCRNFKVFERALLLAQSEEEEITPSRMVSMVERQPVTTKPIRKVVITPPSLSDDEYVEHDRSGSIDITLPMERSVSLTALPPEATERPLTRDELLNFLKTTKFNSW